MIDSPRPGAQIRKSTTAGHGPSNADEFVHTSATSSDTTPALPDTRVTPGTILWTLTHAESTAQARRWVTPNGLELELLIWSGHRVEGQEDLCWSQLFGSEESLADMASSKKRQLQVSGWVEDVDAAR